VLRELKMYVVSSLHKLGACLNSAIDIPEVAWC